MVGVDGVRATSDVEVAHDVSAEIAHGCRDEALGAPALGDERGWCGWEDAEDGVGVVGLTAAGRSCSVQLYPVEYKFRGGHRVQVQELEPFRRLAQTNVASLRHG